MAFTIKDKIALVTGANRGIGKSIVETLLKNGASKVYAAVRNPDSAADLVKASSRVVALELDLAKPATIVAAAKVAKDVQLVVNNAGVLKAANPLAAGAIDALQFELDVNVFGLIRMARAFAPVLAANGGGAFVQLNSVASLKSFADFATYSASKAAAYSITQGLRDTLKKQGTQVVSVHPGPIATDMANDAGLGAIAEPASLVADGIVAALAAGEFHAFPDSMARKFWAAYQGFAKSVVEADLGEA
jgi:NAD(P)-dependent dehydrogenase (short-subunit alcohol dehydrogenase family)